jgi:hypothetical protein
MATAEPWCRVTILGSDGAELASYALAGPGSPDLATVDVVARLALGARRPGGDIVLTDVSQALADLLELVGLSVEMKRQVEPREETLGVEDGEEE